MNLAEPKPTGAAETANHTEPTEDRATQKDHTATLKSTFGCGFDGALLSRRFCAGPSLGCLAVSKHGLGFAVKQGQR